MFELLGGLLGGIGGLFGKKSKTDQSFERTSDTTSDASSTDKATGTDLSPALLASLEGMFQNVVKGGGFQTANNALSGRLSQLVNQSKQPAFDATGFAEGITRQAGAMAGLDLESSINGILSASGTTESGNSMSALLANKLRNQTASNLAGISANARATGEGIRQSGEKLITDSISGLAGGLEQGILGLIQSTRGASTSGTQTSTGTAKTTEVTKGKGNESGTKKDNPLQGFADAFTNLTNARKEA